MKKLAKKMNNTLFDAASGEMIFALLGTIFIIYVVITLLFIAGLVTVTVLLVKRARRKRMARIVTPEINSKTGEDQ